MPKTAGAQPMKRQQGRHGAFPNAPCMIREDVDLHNASARLRFAAGLASRLLGRAIAAVRKVVTGGTLAIRLMVAGTLLVAGLPLLTILLYIWGFPATSIPMPIVVLVDGLQVLIILNAIVVVAQLVVRSGVSVPRVSGRRRLKDEEQKFPASPRSSPVGVREWSLTLADIIWQQERRGRPEFSPAALAYVRDAVIVELDHRRCAEALAERALELELLLAERSTAGGMVHDRR
jgi:hypothetical protein